MNGLLVDFLTWPRNIININSEKILDLLEENKKGRLLDIGCDDGRFIGLKNMIKKKSIMNHYSHDKIIY